MRSRKKCSKQATFQSGTRNKLGQNRFDKITHIGWVNGPLILGLLTRIRQEKKRVIFEFQLGGKSFDAWSAKCNGWGAENMKLFKVGYSYIVSGTKIAQRIGVMDRSTNASFKFKICLSQIRVVEEKEKRGALPLDDITQPFQKMNSRINSKRSFNLPAQDVQIQSGDVRRYMGCKQCYRGLPTPTKSGMYNCTICKKKWIDRTVCLVIWNIRLTDKSGNTLENVVCFHRECENLLGKYAVELVCKSSSDLDARNIFGDILGTTIDCDIIRQKPTRSGKKFFNVAKTKLENIRIRELRRSTSKNGNEDLIPSPTNVGVVEAGNLRMRCPCEDDTSDEEDAENEYPIIPLRESANENRVPCRPHNVDPKSVYQLKPTRQGYVGLALMINMVFPKHSKERVGSKNDVKRLKFMFSRLRIKLFNNDAILDVKKEEFRPLLESFKKELIDGEYSSLFFVIMSHGRLYTMRLGDWSPINVYKHIVPVFGENQFPEFRGKPKIFFFHSCQNMNIETDAEREMMNDLWEVDVNEKLIDVLECYPCSPGLKAKRSPSTGSRFMQAVVDEFLLNSPTMHIEEMLKQVQERMRHSNTSCANIAVYKPMLFSKWFYFPPQWQHAQDMDLDEQ